MASAISGVYAEGYIHKPFTELLPFFLVLEIFTVIFLPFVPVSPVREKLTENVETNEHF